ncbi:hypothetical protein HDU97_001598 [Phlyctochytrium planicorne]|nr:hypothetical protein HDU97_001598 [Phlyctochytrium planicorne]
MPLAIADAAIQWTPCPTGPPTLCATLQVPLDHLNGSDTRTISIALSRYPAPTKPSLGSVLVNPGGPGGPGASFVQVNGKRISSSVGDRFDIIGFDPRGVGQSNAVQCFESGSHQFHFESFPIGIPGDPGYIGFGEYAGRGNVYAAGCGKFSGSLLPYISTASTARDMDLIRQNLNEELLHFIGYSYGTFLGTTYINMFPDRVGKVLLDGVANPIAFTQDYISWVISEHADANKVFEGFCQECELAGADSCALAGIEPRMASSNGDQQVVSLNSHSKTRRGKRVEAVLREFFQDLEELPLVAPDASIPGVVTKADAMGLLFNTLYRPKSYQATSKIFADAIVSRDGSAIKDRLSSVDNPQDFCPADITGGRGSFLTVKCNDGEDMSKYSIDFFRTGYERIRKASWLGGPSWAESSITCKYWKSRPVERYAGPWNKALKNKILIVGNTFDPVTPLANAKRLHRFLSPSNSSFLLIHNGFGHTSNGQPGSCTIQAIANYFVNGTFPDGGKIETSECIAELPLFPKAKANLFKTAGAAEDVTKISDFVVDSIKF